MQRFFTVLIALGVVFGLTSCGGDTKVSDPAIQGAVDDILSDPEFPGTRAQAECFVNYILDNTSLTPENFDDDSVDIEDSEAINELMAAYITGAVTCDIEIDFFGE